MAKVLPFKGIRYNSEKIQNLSEVTAPPYDIISPAEKDALYDLHPQNVIRLEFGKDSDSDNDDNNKYTRAGQTLKDWIDEQILIFEDEPAFYVYEQIFTLLNDTPRSLKGLVTLVELAEFSEKIVLPHELTLSKAKTDRFNLMCATNANFSQIYSLYMDPEKNITSIINAQSTRKPDISFTSAEGVVQNIWIIKDKTAQADITKHFEEKQLFIADGHHRYETALNYRNTRRAQNPAYSPDDAFNYQMMMLVEMDDDGLVVFPTHRMIKDLPAFDEINLISSLTDDFTISKIHVADGDLRAVIDEKMSKPDDSAVFALYTGQDHYYLLTLKDYSAIDQKLAGFSEAYRHLEVNVLHKMILEEHLKIDEENMAQQRNLIYTRDAREALDLLKSGDCQAVFFLKPTKISEIKDISLANEKMPQKSTYFWPKLVTGIIMNSLDGKV